MNIEQTVISQYGNSSTIGRLIQNMNSYFSADADFDNFYNTIFNVSTANLFGLAIWSRIVGIPDALIVELQEYLSDPDTFRSLILLKALSNISRATAPAINQLLQNWLGGSNPRAYVVDLGQMQILYQFEFALTPIQLLILQNSGIFLRPAGVLATIESGAYPFIGFAEMGQPWVTTMGNGIFSQGGIEL